MQAKLEKNIFYWLYFLQVAKLYLRLPALHRIVSQQSLNNFHLLTVHEIRDPLINKICPQGGAKTCSKSH